MQMFMKSFVKQNWLQRKTKTNANGLRVFNDRNGAVSKILQWVFDDNIKSTLPEEINTIQ